MSIMLNRGYTRNFVKTLKALSSHGSTAIRNLFLMEEPRCLHVLQSGKNWIVYWPEIITYSVFDNQESVRLGGAGIYAEKFVIAVGSCPGDVVPEASRRRAHVGFSLLLIHTEIVTIRDMALAKSSTQPCEILNGLTSTGDDL
jgi:hypothetical protein